MFLFLIGYRSWCNRPIRSVIILVIKQIGLPVTWSSDLLIACVITNRIGLHSVLKLLLINDQYLTNINLRWIHSWLKILPLIFSDHLVLGVVF